MKQLILKTKQDWANWFIPHNENWNIYPSCEEKFLWMFTEESRLELIEEFKKKLEE